MNVCAEFHSKGMENNEVIIQKLRCHRFANFPNVHVILSKPKNAEETHSLFAHGLERERWRWEMELELNHMTYDLILTPKTK